VPKITSAKRLKRLVLQGAWGQLFAGVMPHLIAAYDREALPCLRSQCSKTCGAGSILCRGAAYERGA